MKKLRKLKNGKTEKRKNRIIKASKFTFLFKTLSKKRHFWNIFSVNQHFLWEKIEPKISYEKTSKTAKWKNWKKEKQDQKEIKIYIFV